MKNDLSLKRKLIAIGAVLLVMAMLSISVTLWVTWKLEGSGGAINEAGRLRMQAYRLALLSNVGERSAVQELSQKFDESLILLAKGDPSRPLFVTWNDAKQLEFSKIQSEWANIKSLASLGPISNGQKGLVDDFVSRIDRFVQSIEVEMDYWTGVLHIFQFGMMVLSLMATLVIMYVGHSVILDPVMKLRFGFDQIKAGRMNTRIKIESTDEFGDLALGFNEMTAELQGLYEGLEAKVEEKTRHLKEEQDRLSSLYEVSSFMSTESNLENLAKGFSDRVLRIVHCDSVAIRWTDEANQRYFLLAGTNLPESITHNEHCIMAGQCHCGASQEANSYKVISFDLARGVDQYCVKAGYQTLITIPINFQNRKMGEINLFYKSTNQLDPSQRTLLETLAHHLASAIEGLRIKAMEREATIANERGFLARELHDSIAQSLAFLKLKAGMLRDSIAQSNHEKSNNILNELDEGLRESYNDVRELLLHFRTRTNMEDVESAIKVTLQKFEHQSGVKTSFMNEGQGLPLPADVQIQVMHVIQEALSNVRKHANAKHVTLKVTQAPVWQFEVCDDGRGFTSEVGQLDSTHVGLSIMDERAKKIGGAVDVLSVPGKGTKVTLKLPRNLTVGV
jgi:two-component system nitrate/nitrite sensor histidine kinase NarX